MFKRLNTGGESLSEQEVRNCTARMAGKDGVTFYDFLIECAQYPAFNTCTSTLPEGQRDRRGDEELVLRFLALKNARDLFKGSVTDWLDHYQEKAVFNPSFAEQTYRFPLIEGLIYIPQPAYLLFRVTNPIGFAS
jgi:hypothetical protein